MKPNLAGVPSSLHFFFKNLLNKGIGADNLKESYAYKANYPDNLMLRLEGSQLQYSADKGKTWTTLTNEGVI